MIEFQPAISPSASLDLVFQALADPTRRAMLSDLGLRERSVGEQAAPHRVSLAAASKHTKTLERAGLVKRTVQARTHLCAHDAAPLADADGWLRQYAQFWDKRLDALESLLHAADAPPPTPSPKEPSP